MKVGVPPSQHILSRTNQGDGRQVSVKDCDRGMRSINEKNYGLHSSEHICGESIIQDKKLKRIRSNEEKRQSPEKSAQVLQSSKISTISINKGSTSKLQSNLDSKKTNLVQKQTRMFDNNTFRNRRKNPLKVKANEATEVSTESEVENSKSQTTNSHLGDLKNISSRQRLMAGRYRKSIPSQQNIHESVSSKKMGLDKEKFIQQTNIGKKSVSCSEDCDLNATPSASREFETSTRLSFPPNRRRELYQSAKGVSTMSSTTVKKQHTIKNAKEASSNFEDSGSFREGRIHGNKHNHISRQITSSTNDRNPNYYIRKSNDTFSQQGTQQNHQDNKNSKNVPKPSDTIDSHLPRKSCVGDSSFDKETVQHSTKTIENTVPILVMNIKEQGESINSDISSLKVEANSYLNEKVRSSLEKENLSLKKGDVIQKTVNESHRGPVVNSKSFDSTSAIDGDHIISNSIHDKTPSSPFPIDASYIAKNNESHYQHSIEEMFHSSILQFDEHDNLPLSFVKNEEMGVIVTPDHAHQQTSNVMVNRLDEGSINSPPPLIRSHRCMDSTDDSTSAKNTTTAIDTHVYKTPFERLDNEPQSHISVGNEQNDMTPSGSFNFSDIITHNVSRSTDSQDDSNNEIITSTMKKTEEFDESLDSFIKSSLISNDSYDSEGTEKASNVTASTFNTRDTLRSRLMSSYLDKSKELDGDVTGSYVSDDESIFDEISESIVDSEESIESVLSHNNTQEGMTQDEKNNKAEADPRELNSVDASQNLTTTSDHEGNIRHNQNESEDTDDIISLIQINESKSCGSKIFSIFDDFCFNFGMQSSHVEKIKNESELEESDTKLIKGCGNKVKSGSPKSTQAFSDVAKMKRSENMTAVSRHRDIEVVSRNLNEKFTQVTNENNYALKNDQTSDLESLEKDNMSSRHQLSMIKEAQERIDQVLSQRNKMVYSPSTSSTFSSEGYLSADDTHWKLSDNPLD